jgi:outer membrane protein OmpA-like peptidoglycan-associated protein
MNKRLIITGLVYLVLVFCAYFSYTMIVVPAQHQQEIEAKKEEEKAALAVKEKEMREQKLREEEFKAEQKRIVYIIESQRLIFARGTSDLTNSSVLILDSVVKALTSNALASHAITIQSNPAISGDVEANKALALTRAKAAEQYLNTHGIDSQRIKVVVGNPETVTSVQFLLN